MHNAHKQTDKSTVKLQQDFQGTVKFPLHVLPLYVIFSVCELRNKLIA